MPVRPPHHQLLHNNEVPSDTEIEDIKALISSTRNMIRSSIAMPMSAASPRWDLNSTLQCIQQFSKYRCILSAARRVPGEVLTEIFHHLLSEDDQGAEYTSVAQVCRHWRMIMKPLLPSAGTFVAPRGITSSSGRTKGALREFNSFLESMPLPSTSPFSVVIADPLKHGDLKNPLIDAIFSQICRVVSLEITLEPSEPFFAALTQRLTDQLGALRTLKLTISGSPGKYSGSLYLFEGAKSLRHLELITLMKVLIKFSISQLISYKEHSLGDINVDHIRNGPKLKQLEHTRYTPISTPYCLDHFQWSENPLLLTSLDIKTYNVDANYSRSVDHEWSEDHLDNTNGHVLAIPYSTLPHLQEIRIRDPDRSPIPSLIHLIQISFSGQSLTLTKIAFYGLRCQPGQLYKLLTLTPKLTHLECNDISPLDALLLTKLTSHLPIPLLHTLIIHNASNLKDIQELVIRRNASSASSLCQPLHTVRLMYQNPVDALQRFKELTPGMHGTHPALEKSVQRLKELADSIGEGTNSKKRLPIRKDNQSIFQRIIAPSLQEHTREAVIVLTELEAVELSDPYIIKLSYIHVLHSFSLLRFSATGSEPSDSTISKRIKLLLNRWIAAFQLQQLLYSLEHPSSSVPKWIMISPHCISLDRLYSSDFRFVGEDTMGSEKDVPPTDYDILYGHYRCPTQEEIFWVRKDCSSGIITNAP